MKFSTYKKVKAVLDTPAAARSYDYTFKCQRFSHTKEGKVTHSYDVLLIPKNDHIHIPNWIFRDLQDAGLRPTCHINFSGKGHLLFF